MDFPKKVEIWQIDLHGAKGHEQKKERPAAVWKDLDHVKMAIVLPITETIDREKFAYTYRIAPCCKNGLKEESIVLIFQMRAIGKRDLLKNLGNWKKGT